MKHITIPFPIHYENNEQHSDNNEQHSDNNERHYDNNEKHSDNSARHSEKPPVKHKTASIHNEKCEITSPAKLVCEKTKVN